jgi:hypothetical protein
MNDEARMLNGGARANFQASSIQLAVKPRFPKAFVGEDEEDEEEDWRAETGLSGEIRRNPAIEFKKSACRTGNHEFLRLSQNEALAAGCRPNSPARCRRSGGGPSRPWESESVKACQALSDLFFKII